MKPKTRRLHISLLLISGVLAGISFPAMAHHCKGAHAGDPGCDGGGGGGDGGSTGDTARLTLNCTFNDDPGDSLLSDGLGVYQNDVDNVTCQTGDSVETHSASHVRLRSPSRGNVKNAVRKFDFAIDESSCTDSDGCAAVPDGVFEAAASIDDMETASFGARAYAGTDGLAVPHIQNLTPGGEYEISMGFALEGTVERWAFQFMAREVPEDFKDGSRCNLANPANAISDDVTLFVWPDSDSDGKPDGFTVTTGTLANTGVIPPTVTPGARLATLCSNVDANGNGCAGPGSSDLCHLISKMDVQFTLHTETQ